MGAELRMRDRRSGDRESAAGHRVSLSASDVAEPGSAVALAAINHLIGQSSASERTLLRAWLPNAYGIVRPLGWWMDRSLCVGHVRSSLQAVSEVVDGATLSRWLGISEPLIERFIRGGLLDPPSWVRARIWLLSTGPGTDLLIALHVMRALYPQADRDLFASVGLLTMDYLEAECVRLRIPAPEWIGHARALPDLGPADRLAAG